jgi:cation diffusion facilitator family transporter
MASESKTAIVAAIAGNLAIAATKLIAAYVTGSSAMLSEGIHSIVDTGNGGLLLFGMRQSRKPPDAIHPFGHGKELYFWALIVAILIFALGGGMSVYEGITHIRHPHSGDPTWNYVVLSFAIVFESISFFFAYRAFRTELKDDRTIFQTIRASKDPTTFTVLFEDTAALLGLLVAFAGIFLGHVLENPYLDGVASIVIGLILGGVAGFLAFETKGLLIGEGVSPKTLASVRTIVRNDDAVDQVKKSLTMHFGPNEVLLALEVTFKKHLRVVQIAEAINRLEKRISEKHPEIKHIFVEAKAIKPDRQESAKTG